MTTQTDFDGFTFDVKAIPVQVLNTFDEDILCAIEAARRVASAHGRKFSIRVEGGRVLFTRVA